MNHTKSSVILFPRQGKPANTSLWIDSMQANSTSLDITLADIAADYLTDPHAGVSCSTWNKISVHQKEYLAGLALREMGSEKYIALSENNDLPTLCDYLAMYMMGLNDDHSLAYSFSQAIVSYFADDLANRLDQKLNELRHDGMTASIDSVTGETIWRTLSC